MNIKVSDLIAEYLKVQGIQVIFGIVGSANSHIFDSIHQLGYTQIVPVHHEQAAVMAMGAYYRASGKLSAAIVTAGAGSSNAITGVISNWADSIPGIIFSGQEQTYHLKNYKNMRMYGIQGFNSSEMVRGITKHSETIIDSERIQELLEYVFYLTISHRPGPVWIDVPFDIQAKQVEKREWKILEPYNPYQYDAAPIQIGKDIDYVIDKLKQAKRPVIWGGHGVRLGQAKMEFQKLVSSLGIPTLLTWSAIDLLDEKNPNYYGRAGVTSHRHSNFIIQNSDFILLLGSRLSLLQAGYDIDLLAPKAKIALVDIDTNEWARNYKKYDRFIQMDCKTFLNELNKELDGISFDKSDWISYCQKMKEKYPLITPEHSHKNGYVNSYQFVDELSNQLEGNEVIVTDMGTGLLSGHYGMKLKPDNIMFTSLGLGEMGYGLPGAIGAAFAHPNRKVICLNCDGGMMMNLQELQTIVHNKLNIKIVVFNNDGYLMIKHTQKMLFGGRYTSVNESTGVTCPDYTKLGKAFGFETFQIKHPEDMTYTTLEFLMSRGPAILEVFMDPEQDFLPKVKGVPDKDGNITAGTLEEMTPILPFKDIEEAMISGVSEKSKNIKRP